MSAVVFALVYLLTEALPPIYKEIGFMPSEASLPFLSIGVGMLAGIPTWILARHERKGCPFALRYKLLGMLIRAPIWLEGFGSLSRLFRHALTPYSS
jgi:hypothetical protein